MVVGVIGVEPGFIYIKSSYNFEQARNLTNETVGLARDVSGPPPKPLIVHLVILLGVSLLHVLLLFFLLVAMFVVGVMRPMSRFCSLAHGRVDIGCCSPLRNCWPAWREENEARPPAPLAC